MSGSPNESFLSEPPRRKRGRPPGSRKKDQAELLKLQQRRLASEESRAENGDGIRVSNHIIPSPLPGEAAQEERLAYTLAEEQLTLFSSVLRKLVRRDRAEIIRVARALEVSENTVYRWMNGSSEPRVMHLRRLLEVFPNQRESLKHAISQTFGEFAEPLAPALCEVRKEIYHQVLEIGTRVSDGETRFWQISQTIFTQALQHLDAERNGLAFAVAKLMPPWQDGIHTLREVLMHGTAPWPTLTESRLYLGSTTLAGTAVALQRTQYWDNTEPGNRAQVEIDLFEQSACAIPIMRGNLIGGVIVVSSARPYFFRDAIACQAVETYALLIGTALADRDFYPHELICLRPMPALAWQRQRIAQVYDQSILAYAQADGLSFREAELRVQRELERAFEEQAGAERTQTRADVPAYDT